eukprot:COSAG06_NODE_1558_length_9107_cov_5.238677_4_plen_285_part_00
MEALPDSQLHVYPAHGPCNSVYVCAGEYQGYPYFVTEGGRKLHRCTNGGEWCITWNEVDEGILARPIAWAADNEDGRLSVGEDLPWKYLSDVDAEDAQIQVTLLHDAQEIEQHRDRLLALERVSSGAAIAAARAQLQGVLAIAIEGLPNPFNEPGKYNSVYAVAADEHEGCVHFATADGAEHLYYAHGEIGGGARWVLLDRLGAMEDRPDVYLHATDGLLPEGRRVPWRYWSGFDRFVEVHLRVTCLRTEAEMVEHGKPLCLHFAAIFPHVPGTHHHYAVYDMY